MAPPLPRDLEDDHHRLARQLVARNSMVIGIAIGFLIGAAFGATVL